MDGNDLKDGGNSFPVSLKWYWTVVCIQTILNVLLYCILLNGAVFDAQTNFISAITGVLIVFPILSLILGLVISLVPYKGISYKKKYFPSTLLIFFVLNSFFSLAIIVGVGRLIITGKV